MSLFLYYNVVTFCLGFVVGRIVSLTPTTNPSNENIQSVEDTIDNNPQFAYPPRYVNNDIK